MAQVDFSDLIPGQAKPKAQPSGYVPTTTFRSDVDATLGPGRWRDTGDFRTPARENQLRAQGAATARGVSKHSLGTPDAPGAHDIVPQGMDFQKAAAALQARGYKVLPEGPAGGQGAHLHVESPKASLDFSDLVPVQKPQSSVDFGDLVPKGEAASPSRSNAVAQDATRVQPKSGGAQGPIAILEKYLSDTYGKEVRGAMHTAAEDVREDVAYNKAGRPGGIVKSFTDPVGPGGVLRGGKELLDAANVPMAAVFGGPFRAGVARPVAEAESRIPTPPGRKPETREQIEDRTMGALAGLRPGEGKLPEFAPRSPLEAKLPKAKVPEPPREPVTGIVGNEIKPAERTANALYRLGGARTADKIEMRQFKRDLPAEIKDPKTREDLYHALEDKLVDPQAEIPEHLKPAYEALQPYFKEQTEGINQLRAMNDPGVDKFLDDTGYVHRIREGEPNLIEPDGGAPRSPFQTRSSLTTRPDSARQRKFLVLEDANGKRTFEPPNPTNREWTPGMTVRHPVTDQVVTVKQPTTREIEANTNVRYQKDALDNTLSNVMQIRRAIRNKEVLTQTLEDMKRRGVAHHAEWYYRDPEGKLQVARANEQAPKGFQSLHDNPHTKGWVFDPEDAQVQELQDWLPKREGRWLQDLDRINNFMLRSNFLSPFVHPKNIAEFWGASRGADWLDPGAYGRFAKTTSEATREVLTMGPKFKQLLREGSALLSGDARTNDFQESLVHKAGGELINDPKSFAALRKAFGPIVGTPAEIYTRFQEASHKMMWTLGDIMMMQRVLENQEKGMAVRDAIRKTEEMIPNYRVPAQMLDNPTVGRMLSKTFGGNRLFSIGRYHYNRMAAWGRMFKKIAKGSPEEQKEALGQFLATAVIGSVVYPLMDRALQLASGNKNARFKRGGITALPDAAEGVSNGRENMAQAIAQVLDISPMAELAKDEITQKDYFGQDLYSKYAPDELNAAREIEEPASQFGPFRMGIDAARQSYGPERVLGGFIGADLPQRPQGQAPGRVQKMLRGRERKKANQDPLAQGLRAIEQAGAR